MKKIILMFTAILFIHISSFAQNVRIIHGPYLQAIDETEVTIVWVTDKNAVSWVEVAPAGNDSFYGAQRPQYYETRNGNRVVGKLHKIHIPNLSKGTGYRYRVFSREVLEYEGQHRVLYGNVASTNVYSRKPLRFTTLDGAKPEMSFVVLNDIHSRLDDFNALSKNVEYGKTDFVIFNGDMVSSMIDEQQFFSGFMDDAVKLFASEVPMFFARGNHETRGKFSVSFPDYFPTPTGRLYYAFSHGNVRFIVLDAGEDKPDSDVEYSGLAQFDAYRTEQQDWLRMELESDDFKKAVYRVVVIHIPPLGSDWHGPLDVKKKFLPLLNNQGITVMLCGHTHRYQYIEPDGENLGFPILINAQNSNLEVVVGSNGMMIKRNDVDGKELNSFSFKPMK
ncbi:MAG: metallophosphoesterase [Prolixibacteraceae bacterium]|nr:metallophosphoesterase [Prolixibacteraceae bacterium]